ncbi:unnamed protein product [Taenia asiatica]|uniref:CUE domain-containing protein n=1 Tax=Taenia asiatica TaxID=60517 RepID=A0A0R3VZC2_TAEAS|nr:unnamed protein product [Taenia asiatica]
MDVNVTQSILSTVPSYPPQYANILLNVQPRFVEYVAEEHEDLAAPLTNMSAQTLHYVTEHVPRFGALLSNLSSTTLEAVLDKVSDGDIVQYLGGVDDEVVRALVAEVLSLTKHAPVEAMTTTLPLEEKEEEESEHKQREDEERRRRSLGMSKMGRSVPAKTLTKTPFATEAPLLTDEELELVRSNIPLIDKVLSTSSSRQLAITRGKVPDVA